LQKKNLNETMQLKLEKASWVTSKMTVSLHNKYFKVLAKFSQPERFLSSIEKKGTLSIFRLTEQNTYKHSRVSVRLKET